MYLVTSGLPWQGVAGETHARTLALFALDALLTIESVPCAGRPLTAKVGLHTGPLTAGLIGKTRRYYRIFGDTVNVSSRMMSTGNDGRVHASEATARAMLGLNAAAALPVHVAGDAVQVVVVRNGASDGIRVTVRGDTFVKGKGLMKTYWLEPILARQNRAMTLLRLRSRPAADGRTFSPTAASPANLFIERMSRELQWRTETITITAGSDGSRRGGSSRSSSKTSEQTINMQHPVPPRHPGRTGTLSVGSGGSRRVVSSASSSKTSNHTVNSQLPVVSRHPVRSLVAMSSRVMFPVRSTNRMSRSPRHQPLPEDLRIPVPFGNDSAVTEAPRPAPQSVRIPARRSWTLNLQLSLEPPNQTASHTLPGAVAVTETTAVSGVLPCSAMSDEGLAPILPAASATMAAGSSRSVSARRATTRRLLSARNRVVSVTRHSPVQVLPYPVDDLSAHHTDIMPPTGWIVTEQHGGTAPEASLSLTDVYNGEDIPVFGAATSVVFHDGIRSGAQHFEPELPWGSWLKSTVLGDIIAAVCAPAVCAPLRLRFDDVDIEQRATLDLLSHTLRATAAVMSLWCACFMIALVLASALPGLGENHMSVTAALLAPIVATAAVGGAAFITHNRWLPGLLDTTQRRLGWTLLASCLCGTATVVWYCLGPGARMRAGRASAASAGVSRDGGASPFEGQIFMSLIIVTFLQAVAHMRLPFVHTAIVTVACCVLTFGFVVSGITGAADWPSDTVSLGIWSILAGVGSNALMATMASFAWEARCRTQQLMAAASRAAEAEATALLENLLPPVVVAEYKAGRATKPALAHDVVILWSDIVGFTALASRMEPLQLMAYLNTIYRWEKV